MIIQVIKTKTKGLHLKQEELIEEEDLEVEEEVEALQGDVSIVMKWAINHLGVLNGLIQIREKKGE